MVNDLLLLFCNINSLISILLSEISCWWQLRWNRVVFTPLPCIVLGNPLGSLPCWSQGTATASILQGWNSQWIGNWQCAQSRWWPLPSQCKCLFNPFLRTAFNMAHCRSYKKPLNPDACRLSWSKSVNKLKVTVNVGIFVLYHVVHTQGHGTKTFYLQKNELLSNVSLKLQIYMRCQMKPKLIFLNVTLTLYNNSIHFFVKILASLKQICHCKYRNQSPSHYNKQYMLFLHFLKSICATV